MIEIPLTSSAREAVLISNTPSFLLNRLLIDTSVQATAESFTGSQLYEYFKAMCEIGPGSPESLTQFYVCLAALGIAAEDDVWAAVMELDANIDPWAQSIIALLDSSRTSAYSFEELTASAPSIRNPVPANAEQWGDQEEPALQQEQLV